MNSEVKRHKQKGGTCWFHGIVNGLLMSPIARKILIHRLKFVSHGERLTNIKGKSIFSQIACPAKHARSAVFWDYIRERLRGGRVPMNVQNRNIILSSGLRNNSVKGGSFTDMYNLYKKLFPGDYKISFIGKETPTFVFKHGKKFDRVIIHHDVKYILSHAYITLIGPTSAHIVAGFIKHGVPMIYNSAKNSFHALNWDLPFDKFGKYTKDVHKVAVYVKAT